MAAKIDPAAFLWPFCPCSGRRLAHRGSCYSFHFLNIFFFLFFSLLRSEPRSVFHPRLQCDNKKEGERSGGSDSGRCHSSFGAQLKCTWLQGPAGLRARGEVDPIVVEEGAEILEIFVSPRIGEVMPLESVRYISLSYIP